MAAPKIRPLSDRLVVKTEDFESKTPGGIVIPDTANQDKPMKGEVVAIGTGRRTDDGKLQPLQVKVGDKVLFGKYAGTNFKFDGIEYLVMREDDVVGIID